MRRCYPTAGQKVATQKERRTRGARLRFRADDQTEALVVRAARVERGKRTDYCLSFRAEAARGTGAHHEMLVLSDRDRDAFCDVSVHPAMLG